MQIIKTLVIDDEPYARARIIKLLSDFDFVEVLGESKNGQEAIEQIRDYQPDLVFLDIQMPDYTGFEVLLKSASNQLPFIIFVTAYDQYALKAFDVHATDYLLKPFDNERFTQALLQAHQQIIQKKDALLHQKMVNLINEAKMENEKAQYQIKIKHNGRFIYINPLDVYYLESKGNYIQLHLKSKSYLIRETLQQIKSSLQKNCFLQIHRSILVNCNYIQTVKYTGNNQYKIALKNEVALHSSRGFKASISTYLDRR